MEEQGRLAGRAGIVTGASRGIGLGIARRLIDEGARLVLTATTQDGADRAAAALDAGDRVVALASDAARRAAVAAAVEACLSSFGRLDLAVANAGIERPARLLDVTDADWDAAGITVNAVGPGLVATDMTASVVGEAATSAWYLDRIPAGRFGRPDDVAAAVAFLVSDDAGWITGHHLIVDGGQTVGLDLPDTPGGPS